MDLVSFLRARLDEDEARAREAGDLADVKVAYASRAEQTAQYDFLKQHSPARVLAEVEAKRRIVEQVEAAPWLPSNPDEDEPEYAYGFGRAMYDAARMLALPYADHPDYRDEWRP